MIHDIGRSFEEVAQQIAPRGRVAERGAPAQRKFRVLIICHQMLPRSVRPRSIALALAEKGHDVTFVHTATDARLRTEVYEANGMRWVAVPDMLWGRARAGWDLWSTLKRIGYLKRDGGPYDLIHCFETRPATIHAALYYQRRHGIPIITDWNDWWGRGGIIDHFRPKWYRTLFGRMETYYEEAFRTKGVGLTVIATALAKRAMDLGVPADRICHLQGGTFPDYFVNRDKRECRQRLGYPMEDPILGFSSVDGHWDLELVMKTLARVKRKHPTVKLMLTGRASSTVRELARHHGVEDDLLLTGFLSNEDLPWHMACADLFLLPFPETLYNLGRWPNKFGDYMALGRPTVANPIGDVGTFFEKHPVGLTAGCDSEEFSEKVVQLLDDPGLSQRLGRSARETALQYDYPTLIGKLEDFYSRMLEIHGAASEGRHDSACVKDM